MEFQFNQLGIFMKISAITPLNTNINKLIIQLLRQ